MYNVSQEFKDNINSYSRRINMALTINERVIPKSELITITIEKAITSETTFTLGQTYSSKVEIELYKTAVGVLEGQTIKLSLILEAPSMTAETVPQGTFIITGIEENENKVKITAYDKFYFLVEEYISDLNFPTTLKNIMVEIKNKYGVDYVDNLEDITVESKLSGYTVKDIIGFVASAQGKNAVINTDDKVEFIGYTTTDYQISPNTYIDFQNLNEYSVSGVTCLFGNVGINAGTEEKSVLAFQNPWGNQTIVNNIFNKYKGLTFRNGTVRYTGNFALQPMDIVTIVNTKNETGNLLIGKHLITYSGGLTCEITSCGENKTENNNFINKLATKKTLTQLTIELGNILAEVTEIEKEFGKVEDLIKDTEGKLDGIFDLISDKEASITKTYQALLEITAQEIQQEVKENYSLKTDLEQVHEELSSKIEQTSKDIQYSFTNITEYIKDDLSEFKKEVATYIRFSADGMELGKSDSKFKAKLDNTKLAFLEENFEIAYISNKKLYITDAEVTNQMTIGKYAFVPRSNGNTSIRWIG